MTTETVKLPAGQPVLLTNTDVTTLTFQNVDPQGAYILASDSGVTPPASWSGAPRVGPWEGRVSVALAELFPGTLGATRLWCLSETGGAMAVSYA